MPILRSLCRRFSQLANTLGISPCVVIRSGSAKGMKIHLRNADEDYWFGTKEAPIQEAIVRNLRPGDVFLDIGSNIGFFSLIGATSVGRSGHVYAIEPVHENIRCLQANLACNHIGNVDVVPVAASNTVGMKNFYLAHHNGGSTLAESNIPPDLKGETTVAVTTIDSLVKKDKIRPPNLVKLDVEGAEVEVLEGMRDTLAAYAPTIVFEVDDALPARAEQKFVEIASMLQGFGYAVSSLENAYPDIQWTVMHGIASHPKTAANSGGQPQAH